MYKIIKRYTNGVSISPAFLSHAAVVGSSVWVHPVPQWAQLGGWTPPPFDKLLISTLLKRGEVKCEVILKEK